MIKTIGQRLKETREYRHLSLEKVAAETHIRLRFLQALESDDFSVMPSEVQARGFLRNYARYLGLDLEAVLAELHQEQVQSPEKNEIVFEQAPVLEEAKKDEERQPEQPNTPGDLSAASPFGLAWIKRLIRRVVPDVPDNLQEEESSSPPEGVTTPGPILPDVEEEVKASLEIPSEPDAMSDPAIHQDMIQEPLGAQEQDVENQPESNETARKLFWTGLRKAFRIRLTRLPGQDEPEEEENNEDLDSSGQEPLLADTVQEVYSSQDILKEIGHQLRERREMLSLSLDEIERHTHMRSQLLKALENGNSDLLPSTVQTRGMLQNYAGFLDLDVEAFLLRFADALQARHREKYPQKPVGRRTQPVFPETLPRLRSFIASDLIFGLGMMILLVSFAIWGISSVIATQNRQEEIEPQATSPSIAEALIGTVVETVETPETFVPAADTPLPALPAGTLDLAAPEDNVAVQINIVVVERTYLRVHVDGEDVFDGRALPGNAFPFEAEQSVEILAGNAAALRVTYNQRDLGLLGGFGELVNYVFTAEDVLTPTAEPSSTPTPTPPVTPTPSPTPSPTPTIPAEGEAL